jgi:flagellin
MPVITTNTAANTALRYLNQNAADQSSALSKLASGSNITKASDDAAGLAIGTQLASDVSVLGQAQVNASQASSILQIADGGLSSISDILTRMKTLATEAASGNVTDDQRKDDINTEYAQLSDEIDGIAKGTRYSDASLLDGSSQYASGSGVSFLVGTNAADTITVSISGSTASALGLSGDLTTASGASGLISLLSTAIDTVTKYRASIGAQESRFNFHSQDLSSASENTSAAESTIMDSDVAAQKSKLASADVKYQASVAALAQATQIPRELLSLLQS